MGRARRVAPVLKMAMAYPLRNVFRTGVTLAMFTLVVFTLVVGATTTGSFVESANNLRAFGGGFDVRATVSPATPISDMRVALAQAHGIRPEDFDARRGSWTREIVCSHRARWPRCSASTRKP